MYSYKERRDEPFISVGTFDDANSFAPQEQIWVEQKLSWIHVTEDLSQQ